MTLDSRSLAHLQAGGLLLTDNVRQARVFRRLHDQAQAAAGLRAWPSAQVLPLEAWLSASWDEAVGDRPTLPECLSPTALSWLWSNEAARGAPGLLDPAEQGARARGSWLKLLAYGGGLDDLERWPLTRDQQAFLTWARRVEDGLQSRGACDPGDLARLLVEHGALPKSCPPILLAGFRRLTPAQDALFGALEQAGCAVGQMERRPGTGDYRRYRAADPVSERHDMMAWLRDRLAQQPGGLHAVIVPDLDANRGAIERALAAALQPEIEVPGADGRLRVFDLAGGHPLSLQPIVDAATSALACARGPVDWAVASRLLLSGHLAGGESERGPRVEADLALRRTAGTAGWHAARLAGLAARAGASLFAAAATAALAALSGPARRGAGAWAEAFGACLAAWGWARQSAPGSREYQAARRFGELLHELGSLGAVTRDLDSGEAISQLRRLAAAPFQPESGEPEVFVLDVYDDPGIPLDSLWVAGLTASAWPRPVAVDPLLPIDLQRRLGMPGVTPESRVADASEVLARWRGCAQVLVTSWPQVENDTDADASPLLPVDAAMLETPPVPPIRERLAYAARRHEPVPEAPPTPVSARRAKGGARLLELQAQCAFRAFAELRLAAAPFEEPQAGFDRRLRGIVLHRAMQALWSRLRRQQSLAALDPSGTEALVHDVVESALSDSAPPGVGAATLALERDWQRRAVAGLLEVDRARPAFDVVETERELRLDVGGLDLEVRIDRADRIGDELVLIDYKTGRLRGSAWRGARMDAPQLPLYAVMHPDRPTGIAFAGVYASGARHVGVGRSTEVLPGLVPAERFPLTEDREKGFSWPEIAAHWRAWLERLAADFAAGRSEVDPKLGAATCRNCHLSALCRVEAAGNPDSEDETGDDD